MRFNFSKSMLIIATLSALLSLSGNANDSIKNLVCDLKEHKRHIFAAGAVSSNLVLFVSGSGDKTDFSKGYQVKNEDGEPADGKFGKLENAVALSKYTGVNSDDVMFVVSDSANSFLVTMNSQSVKLLDLSSGSINSTGVKGDIAIEKCYHKGSLHLSSSTPATFFILKSSGAFYKLTFNGHNGILSSNGCSLKDTKQMCLSNSSALVTISSSCSGSPFPSSTFTAGFIGLHTAFIFSKSNEVYLFESGAITSGRTVVLTKVSSDAAWVDSSTPDSNSSTSASTQGSTLNLAIPTIIMLVISLILLIAIVYFARCHCSRDLIQFERLVLYKRASEASNPNQQQATSTTVRKRRPSPNAYVTEKMMERRREKAKRAKEKAAAATASASYSAQKQKKKSKGKSKSKNTSDGSRSPKNSSRGGGTKSGTIQSRAGRRSTSKKRSDTR